MNDGMGNSVMKNGAKWRNRVVLPCGLGCPFALQMRVASSPSFTITSEDVSTSAMSGGTGKEFGVRAELELAGQAHNLSPSERNIRTRRTRTRGLSYKMCRSNITFSNGTFYRRDLWSRKPKCPLRAVVWCLMMNTLLGQSPHIM